MCQLFDTLQIRAEWRNFWIGFCPKICWLSRTCVQNLAKLSRGQRLDGALGCVSARDIFGATANREFRRNTIANATRLMPTPQGAEECIINCHALPKRQSHPHFKPGWIIATVACNPE